MTFPATSITPEQVAAMEDALATGATEISWESGGVRQRIVYRSVAELIRALDYARDRLSAARPASTLAVFQRD